MILYDISLSDLLQLKLKSSETQEILFTLLFFSLSPVSYLVFILSHFTVSFPLQERLSLESYVLLWLLRVCVNTSHTG